MGKKDILEGAKIVGDAAGAKFEELKEGVCVIREKVDKFSSNQEVVNETLIERSDEQEERLQALEDNRYFVRMSRHSLDDMTPIAQERLAAWLQKLVLEMQARGFSPSENQQTFLANIFKNMGLQDELMMIDSLSMLETFGDSSTHEVIYKIFLVFCYLYDTSFILLAQLDDVDQMFKLSVSDKAGIRDILENERIPALGISGLVGMFDPGKPLNSFNVESIIDRHTVIYSHHMLQHKLEKSSYGSYLKSFALLSPKSGKFEEKQRNFLVSLAALFGCPECIYDVDKLCISPQNVNIKQWQDILDTDEKKYAWALDGAVLLSLDPSYDYEKDKVLGYALRGINLNGAQDFVSSAIIMTRANNSPELLDHIKYINRYCKSWKHIADFHGLAFKDMFADLRSDLMKSVRSALSLSLQLCRLGLNSINSQHAFIDHYAEGFFDKLRSKVYYTVTESSRKSNLKELIEFKDRAEQLFDDVEELFNKANLMLSIFGMEKIPMQNSLKYKDFDLDHSMENESWGNNFNHLYNTVNDFIEKLQETSELLIKQLSLFEEGKIHTSILAIKEKEQQDKKIKERDELQAKRTAKIYSNGDSKFVSIKWKNITNIPFDPSDISHITSNGASWMALVGQVLYFSKDGEEWISLADKVDAKLYSSLTHVYNVWILSNSSKILFSEDGAHWQETSLPDCLVGYNLELHSFKDQWLLVADERGEYTYTEKGVFFDSDEKMGYAAPVFYRSKSLVGNWEKWGPASALDEGIVRVSTPVAVNDKLLVASFEYERFYADRKKKPSCEPYVAYISDNKSWKRATWPQEKNDKCEGSFYFIGDKFLFLASDAILSSLNGYEWTTVADNVSHGGSLLKVNDVLFVIPGYNKRVGYLSGDGSSFYEITVYDSGRLDNFATNGKEIIAVFRPSEHETFLRKGILVFE